MLCYQTSEAFVSVSYKPEYQMPDAMRAHTVCCDCRQRQRGEERGHDANRYDPSRLNHTRLGGDEWQAEEENYPKNIL